MVLYSVVTTYHLLEAMIHKIKYNKEDTGTIFISQWLVNKYPWYEELKDIFEIVIPFNAQYHYSEDIENKLNDYFFELLSQNNIDLKLANQIHVFGAEHAFGAFIFQNNFQNYYWEEGAGALSKKDSMLEIFTKVHGVEKANFQYNLHLGDGETDFVVKRFYNKYYQLNEVEGDNLCHFDIGDELQCMAPTDRDIIIKHFYKDDKIHVKENTALVLTEHFANLSVMSWDEQILSYKYLVDYFLSDYNLLFKPHPDDTMYYEYLFDNCEVIRTRFPAEILPFIFDCDPKAVATSSSTSIYGLRNKYDNIMEFNFTFSHNKQFYQLNKYFVALSIADKYLKKGYSLKLVGVNPTFIDNFNRFHKLCSTDYEDLGNNANILNETSIENSVIIIDQIEDVHVNASKISNYLEVLPDDVIVIFINSDENYCFYNYSNGKIWDYLRAVEIKVKAINNMNNIVTIAGPSLIANHKEMIYVYQKGKSMDVYSIKKELPNVGVTVETSDYDWKEEKIKLLEGMLEATEKRLLYYIDREKELLDKLGGE